MNSQNHNTHHSRTDTCIIQRQRGWVTISNSLGESFSATSALHMTSAKKAYDSLYFVSSLKGCTAEGWAACCFSVSSYDVDTG